MANYANLKATINANIKENDNEEITGAILNAQLIAMVNSLGAGYQFMGIATPSTDPGTPDQNVYYIASQPGTYTNFLDSSSNPIIVNDGEVAVMKYNGTWSKAVTGAGTAAQVTQLGYELSLIKCVSTASSAAKSISAPGFVYRNGGSLKIRFAAKNTAISGVTMNVNSQGAKPLFYNSAEVTPLNTWDNGEVVELYYDETYDDNTGAWFARSTDFSSPTDYSGKMASSGDLYDVLERLGASLRAMNMLNLSYKWQKGTVNKDGVPTVSYASAYRFSDYIELIEGHTYYWCAEGNTNVSLYAIFDTNKALIRRVIGDGASREMKTGVFTAQSGDKYAVLTKYSTNNFSGWLIDVTENYFALSTQLEALRSACVLDSDVTVEITSKNIADKSLIFDGLINNQGSIVESDSWKCIKIDISQIEASTKITFGGFYLGRVGYYAFYNGDTKVSSNSFSDPNGAESPVTVVVPSGANLLYIDIASSSSPENPYEYLMVNEGDALLPFVPVEKEVTKINGYKILGAGSDVQNVDIIEDLPISADGSDISVGYAYINSSTGIVTVKLS